MEELNWKKDTTPYIVFPCKKCKQFMYVKCTQKSKRCLRCNYSHIVSEIENIGEIVYGMTQAVELVKKKQNELAIKELGSTPRFSSFGDFRVYPSLQEKKDSVVICDIENEYLLPFLKMLSEMEECYKKVPYYVFELLAENKNIPQEEFKILFRAFILKKIIIQNGKDYIIHLP